MAFLGIVQDTNPALRRAAQPFDLPAEADDARTVVAALDSAAERVAQAHTFGKGMGIAAPQIGIDRMRSGVEPIPVEQYRGTGTNWKY